MTVETHAEELEVYYCQEETIQTDNTPTPYETIERSVNNQGLRELLQAYAIITRNKLQTEVPPDVLDNVMVLFELEEGIQTTETVDVTNTPTLTAELPNGLQCVKFGVIPEHKSTHYMICERLLLPSTSVITKVCIAEDDTYRIDVTINGMPYSDLELIIQNGVELESLDITKPVNALLEFSDETDQFVYSVYNS